VGFGDPPQQHAPPRTARSASLSALLGALLSLVPALIFGGYAFVAPAVFIAIMVLSFSVVVVRGFQGGPPEPVAPGDAGAAGRHVVGPPPVARPNPVDGWVAARQRFHHLRSEFADYECDPLRVLRLPALADASVASTARFVDAFAEAQGLDTDRYPGPAHADRYVAAVGLAGSTWLAACDAAERIRLSGMTPAERGTVERIIKLLTTARESDSEPERLVAYSLAQSELAKLDRAGVVRVPRLAMAALDEAARRALPG
jgi:hypothetical protein